MLRHAPLPLLLLLLTAPLPYPGTSSQRETLPSLRTSGTSKLFLLLHLAILDATSFSRYPLQFNAYHVQGLEIVDTLLFVTAVDRIHRRGWLFQVHRASGRLLRAVELTEGPRIHPGGLSFDGRWLWIPNATYDAHGSTRILAISPQDLSVHHSFIVHHHVSLLAADNQGRLYGTDWNSQYFFVWNAEGQLLARIPSPTDVAYQDCKMIETYLLCGGYRGLWKGVIDLFDPENWHLVHRVLAGRTRWGWPLTREGLALYGDTLYLLPYDGQGELLAFSLSG